jgi:hypothetical protein
MATISNTPRPGYVWDTTDNVWYPIGVGAHTHTAAAVGAIANTLTTTTGDIIYASGANTPARLGIGSTGQVLTVSGGVPTWAAGGKVLQVVQGTLTSNFATSLTSYVDVGLSATITPSSSTSKIMVIVSMPEAYATNSTSSIHCYAQFNLLRSATQLCVGSQGTYNYASSNNPNFYSSFNMSYLDSPATTSAITYKVQAKCGSSASAAVSGNSTQINSIVLMEIGA